MLETLKSLIDSLQTSTIEPERTLVLNDLAMQIARKLRNGRVSINFICTHNSRRSHLSQIWAQTMAAYYGLDSIDCYSGGTEATALFPKVAETLEKQGFMVLKLSQEYNPVYAIRYSDKHLPVVAFSKAYDHPFNPAAGYTAVMTCDSANEACPVVFGAEARFALLYVDPKLSDGKPEMDEVYAKRSLQIASEMKYLFWKAHSVLQNPRMSE